MAGKKKRYRYTVCGIDVTGKPCYHSTMITDQGGHVKNKKWINNHLVDKAKMYRNLGIYKNEEKFGPIIKIPDDELKNDGFKALDDNKKMPLGFTAMYFNLSERKKMGVVIQRKLDNPNFREIAILYYIADGKTLRESEEEKLDVLAPHYYGGHVFEKSLKIFNLYGVHKSCLNKSDLEKIFKERTIYSISGTERVTTIREFLATSKELESMINELRLKELKQAQNNIDFYLPKEKKKKKKSNKNG